MSDILRKVYGLKIFKNSVLRKIFRPKRNHATKDHGKYHEAFQNLYSSLNRTATPVFHAA